MRTRMLAPLALLTLLAVGCSQSLYMQGKSRLRAEQYQPAIDLFYQEIAANPANADAWRELGVAYYRLGDMSKAEEALKQSTKIQPDARTQLYMGLIYESQDLYDQALDAYSLSLGLKSRGKTADMVRGHLDALVDQRLRTEVATALNSEAGIDVDTIPENTIAVANFDGSSLPEELAPIAIGLAEFTATDLSKVVSLTVVERNKLDALLDELQLGASGAVDPATAPRIGRLMGSSRVVTGTVLGLGEDGLRLDGAVVSAADSSAKRTAGVEGQLEGLFDMQKQFVFAIIEDMGITLTAPERDAIAEVPTESMLAFMAYCRGLDFERRGMYSSAEREYSQAAKADNGFSEASVRQATTTIKAAGYEGDLQRFEGAVQSALGAVGIDAKSITLSQVANFSGFIPVIGANLPPFVPPQAGMGIIVVKGDPDAQ